MSIREVSVEYSRTVNLGHFESERVQVGLVGAVGPEQEAHRLAYDLLGEARDITHAQLRLEAERRERQYYPIPPGEKPTVDEEDDPTTGGL
jgi:hypothetical protein